MSDGELAVEVDAAVNVLPGLLFGVEGSREDEGVIQKVAPVSGGDKREAVLDECQRNEGVEGDGEGLLLAEVASQRVVVEDHFACTLPLDILDEEDQLLLLEALDGTVHPIFGDPKIFASITVELVGRHPVPLIAGEDEHHPALVFIERGEKKRSQRRVKRRQLPLRHRRKGADLEEAVEARGGGVAGVKGEELFVIQPIEFIRGKRQLRLDCAGDDDELFDLGQCLEKAVVIVIEYQCRDPLLLEKGAEVVAVDVLEGEDGVLTVEVEPRLLRE